jgi:O-antigen ligase
VAILTRVSTRTVDRVVAVLVALELATIVAATTAQWDILFNGRRVRWLLLAALVVAVGTMVAKSARRPRKVRLPVTLALAFVAVALLSTAWSAAGRLSWPHALLVWVLLAVVGGVGFSVSGDVARIRLQLEAIVAGASLVAIAGVAILAVDRRIALEPAQVAYPTRYRGFGGNPDTAALLLGIVVPIALALALSPGPRRWWHGAACALLVGSIAPSASRGALLAAAVGSLVVVLFAGWSRRRQALAVGGIVLVGVVAIGVSKIPQPLNAPPPAKAGFNANAEIALPLYDDRGYLGNATVGKRSLTTSSGRVTAWEGALRQAHDRLLTGYGFGTEDRVFVDRYPGFFSRRVENAYLATVLELGIAGLALLLALIVSILAPVPRALRTARDRGVVVAATGGFVAGLVIASVQSYLYSVGGTGALAVWLVAALLVAATSQIPNEA